ncbi:MAG: hypothetical protein RIN62_09015 [Lacrimispora sp.]|nr:hypothetical protein [Lacrimispora sp.]
MKAIYDKINTFCFILILTIMVNFLFNLKETRPMIYYHTIFQYSFLIVLGITIFTCVQYLPFKNPIILYFINCIFITISVIIFECIIWRWIVLSIINCFFLATWVFLISGMLTVYYIKRNEADANIINQQLKEWQMNPPASRAE